MRDKASIPDEPSDGQGAAQGGLQTGPLADPAVRAMAVAAFVLMILFLSTVIGTMLTRATSPKGPRSVAERELMIAASAATSSTAAAKALYVEALANNGQQAEAKIVLGQARASLPSTATVSRLDLAEARLLMLGKDYPRAVNAAEAAMKGYVAEHDAAAAKAKSATSTPSAYNANYYDAALVKAYALTKMSRYEEAVSAFDIYLRVDKTASDVFVDRGNAKLAMGDKTGAEQDFRTALKYVPYDTDAQAGLKKIGVAQ